MWIDYSRLLNPHIRNKKLKLKSIDTKINVNFHSLPVQTVWELFVCVCSYKMYFYWLFHFRRNKHINIDFNLKCTGWSSRNREYINALFIFPHLCADEIHIPVRLQYIISMWGEEIRWKLFSHPHFFMLSTFCFVCMILIFWILCLCIYIDFLENRVQKLYERVSEWKREKESMKIEARNFPKWEYILHCNELCKELLFLLFM